MLRARPTADGRGRRGRASGRRGARVPVLRRARPARFRRRHREPGGQARGRRRPRSPTRIPSSQAAATSSSKSTSMTSRLGMRCPSRSRSGRSVAPSSATSNFPTRTKPANSHLALNTIVDESGDERQIMRFNMPFGRVGSREFGTYFIGYARSPEVIEQMLSNMFVGDPPGNYDRILDFSTAVTGNLFFVPTPGLPRRPADSVAPGTSGDRGSHRGRLARYRKPEGGLAVTPRDTGRPTSRAGSGQGRVPQMDARSITRRWGQ